MNLILLLVVLAEVCLGICCWVTPEALRWIAAKLLTRADVIEAAKKEHSRRLQFWTAELGLEREDEVAEMRVLTSHIRR
jgi:hypothetical protein